MKLLKVFAIVMLVEKIGFLDVQNCSVKMKHDMVLLVKNHVNVKTQDVMIMDIAVKNVTKTTKVQIVKPASVKMKELVRKMNVCATTSLKGIFVKKESVKILEYGLRLENASAQRCTKVNFVKLVDVEMEDFARTLNANVHQLMKVFSANITNAKMEKKQKNLDNVSVQKSLPVNFARIACAKTVSVPTKNATVPTISKESFVNSRNSKSKDLYFIKDSKVSFFI